MAAKVAEIELTEPLTPIAISAGYKHYYILVRFHRQPIGWLMLPVGTASSFSAEYLQEEIGKQLSWELTKTGFATYFQADAASVAPTEPISIVVCTRNRTAYLQHCLEALVALPYPTFEIVVVDNAPTNDDTYQLTTRFPVRYVRENRPGLDWARNRGIAEARYDLIAFTDDDARVDPLWLQAIGTAFQQPEVMGVTGYVAPAALETRAQRIFEFHYGGMGHGYEHRLIRGRALTMLQLMWASSFGVGANMAFRKQVFASIGLFDTALDVGTPSGGGGDVEMLHRLVARGHTLAYTPEAIVWHTHRREMAALRKQLFNNGRGFGCYLLTCLRNQSIDRKKVVPIFLHNWLYKWVLKQIFLSRSLVSRYTALIELAGMLSSPFAYRKSQVRAAQLARSADQVRA